MRTISFSVAALLAVAMGGCGILKPTASIPQAPLNDEPMLVDQAMQLRDWDRSDAQYTNMTFVAGPTGFLFAPADDLPYWSYGLIELPLFVGQVIALPVTIWLPPPWTPVNYSGLKVEPTYHAMPPLPDAQPPEQPSAAQTEQQSESDE